MTLVTVFNRDLWRLEREMPELAAVLRVKIETHVAPTVSL